MCGPYRQLSDRFTPANLIEDGQPTERLLTDARDVPKIDKPLEIKKRPEGSFEDLSEQQRANYFILRDALQKIYPYAVDISLGDNGELTKQKLEELLQTEADPEKRKKIQAILNARPGEGRTDLFKELINAYKDDPAKEATLKKLLSAEEGAVSFRNLINQIGRGESIARLLRDVTENKEGINRKETLMRLIELFGNDPRKLAVFKGELAATILKGAFDLPEGKRQQLLKEVRRFYENDPDKLKLIDTALSGQLADTGGKTLLSQLVMQLQPPPNSLVQILKAQEKENYANTISSYSITSDFLKKSVRNDVIELGDRMMVGTRADRQASRLLPNSNTFPPGCPIKLPDVQFGDTRFRATWDGFLSEVKKGKHQLVLPEDPREIINGNNRTRAQEFDNAADWFIRAERVIARDARIIQSALLEEDLRRLGAPESWRMPPITDTRALDTWYLAAHEMNNLMLRVRNQVQCYIDLEKLAPDNASQANPSSAINQLRALGAEIEWNPQTGKLTKCVLPMPKDLSLSLPQNDRTVGALYQWLKDHHEVIDKACDAYKSPLCLRYGDFVEPVRRAKGESDKKGAVIFDSSGQPLRVENCDGEVVTIWHRVAGTVEVIHKDQGTGKFVTKNGQVVEIPRIQADPERKDEGEYKEEFDYTRHSFQTTRTSDGRIVITSQIRYCREHPLNFVRWGSDIDAVFKTNLTTIDGAVAEQEHNVPNEGDYIKVVHNVTQRGALLRASDVVDGWWAWRQKWLFHHGAKIGDMGMNVALLAGGGAEMFVAKSWAGTGLAAMRCAIGASGFLVPSFRAGVFDNSYFKGEDLERVRHIAMMVDVYGVGVGGSMLRWLRHSPHAVAHTGSLLEQTARKSHQLANIAGLLFAPVVYHELDAALDDQDGRGSTDLRVALAREHRGIPEAFFRDGKVDLANPRLRETVMRMFQNSSDILALGTQNPEAKAKVQKLFSECKEIMSRPADYPRRKEFVQRLVGYHNPSGQELLLRRMTQKPEDYTERLEPKTGKRSTTSADPEALANRRLVAALAEQLKGKTQADISEQERIAATQCLLLLSVNALPKDGVLPEGAVLGERDVTVPAHKQRGVQPGQVQPWSDVPETQVKQQFAVADALSYLRRQAAVSSDDLVRHIQELARQSPENPLDKLKRLAAIPDDSNTYPGEQASDLLRQQLLLSQGKADEYARQLASNSPEKGEQELIRLFAEACPAAKYLRQQLSISFAEAQKYVDLLRSEEEPQKSEREKAERELRKLFEPAVNANHLVASDQLWRLGRLGNPDRGVSNDRALAAICMDILANRNLPDELRARVLLDGDCERLGHLVNRLAVEEDAMGPDQIEFWRAINGVRSTDARRLMLEIIASDGRELGGGRSRPDQSGDLRAACTLALWSTHKPPADAQKVLATAQAKWKELSTQPHAFANYAIQVLKPDLQARIEAGQPNIDQVRQAKLDAATMLAQLGRVTLQDGNVYELGHLGLNNRLLECMTVPPYDPQNPRLEINIAHPEITLDALRSLRYEHLTPVQRLALLRLLDTSLQEPDLGKRRAIELAKIAICEDLPQLLNKGRGGAEYDQLRAEARLLLESMFSARSPAYAALCPDLKVAAMKAIREIRWSDARMRQFLEDRLHIGPDPHNPGRQIPYESSMVRRIALEALYQINPLDPGKVATEHRKIELDPMVARVAQELEKKRKTQQPGDPGTIIEDAQELERLLIHPYDCNPKIGEQYVKSSKYKDLISENLSISLRQALESAYGSGAGFSFASGSVSEGYRLSAMGFHVMGDRLKTLSWSEPYRRMESDGDVVIENYRKLSVELCREAEGSANNEAEREKQHRAINAMVYFLLDNCRQCIPEDQKTIRNNFASTLARLCGRRFTVSGNGGPEQEVVVPSNVRHLAFRHVETLLNRPELKADVQMHLLRGLRILHQDGAIDTATAAKNTEKALRHMCRSQMFREPDDEDRADHEKVQLAMLDDMLRYRARYEGAMGVISACAQDHPYENVRGRAKDILGLLTDGVTLTRDDVLVHPDEGSSPAARAANLKLAIKQLGAEVEIPDSEIFRENLVREIFRTVYGNPITTADDPRLPVLLNLAQTSEDPRVRAALAHALLDVKIQDGRMALTSLSMLNDLALTDKTMRGQEARERLDLIAREGEHGRSFLQRLERFGKERHESVSWIFTDAEHGSNPVRRQPLDPSAVRAAIEGLVPFIYPDKGKKSSIDKDKPQPPVNSSEYMRAFARAWCTNGFDVKNDYLLNLTRNMMFSPNQQAVLAACHVMLRCPANVADEFDKRNALDLLILLSKTGATQAIKVEAARLLNLKETEPAKGEMADLLRDAYRFQLRVGDLMTDAESRRADLDAIQRHIALLQSGTDQINRETQLIILKTERLKRETDLLNQETTRKKRLLEEGVGLTWQQVEESTNPQMPIAERIAIFEQALRNPGENNENLVKAVFQLTAHNPITDPTDTRLPLLLRLGHTYRDTRVEEACGLALLTAETPQAILAGAWMLPDVQARGKEGQVQECKELLDKLAARSPESRAKVEELYRHARDRSFGAIWTFQDTQHGLAKQAQINDPEAIRSKIRAVESALADRTLPGRLRVRAIAEAWVACNFNDPTGTLLPLSRRLLRESTDEQAKLATIYAMVKTKSKGLQLSDKTLIETTLAHLSQNAGNPQIKEEARFLADTLEEAQSKVQAANNVRWKKHAEALAEIQPDLDRLDAEVFRLMKQGGNEEEILKLREKMDLQLLRAHRILLNLPPGASNAEIMDALKQQAGIPPTGTYSRWDWDEYQTALEAMRLGLLPTASEEEVEARRERLLFEELRAQYKIDPKLPDDEARREIEIEKERIERKVYGDEHPDANLVGFPKKKKERSSRNRHFTHPLSPPDEHVVPR